MSSYIKKNDLFFCNHERQSNTIPISKAGGPDALRVFRSKDAVQELVERDLWLRIKVTIFPKRIDEIGMFLKELLCLTEKLLRY